MNKELLLGIAIARFMGYTVTPLTDPDPISPKRPLIWSLNDPAGKRIQRFPRHVYAEDDVWSNLLYGDSVMIKRNPFRLFRDWNQMMLVHQTIGQLAGGIYMASLGNGSCSIRITQTRQNQTGDKRFNLSDIDPDGDTFQSALRNFGRFAQLYNEQKLPHQIK